MDLPGSIARVLDAALAARPYATAVEAASGAWSYAELDDRLGQRVAAVVECPVVESPVATPDFTELCGRELAPYKVPEIWVRVGALPLNAMGKVERTKPAALVDGQVDGGEASEGGERARG